MQQNKTKIKLNNLMRKNFFKKYNFKEKVNHSNQKNNKSNNYLNKGKCIILQAFIKNLN